MLTKSNQPGEGYGAAVALAADIHSFAFQKVQIYYELNSCLFNKYAV